MCIPFVNYNIKVLFCCCLCLSVVTVLPPFYKALSDFNYLITKKRVTLIQVTPYSLVF